MTDHRPDQILAWLRDERAETRAAALQNAVASGVDIEAFWSELPRLSRDPNADVRWRTATLLGTSGRAKDIGVFVPHLESLFDDDTRPLPALRLGTVGGMARTVVAGYYLNHGSTRRCAP